MWWLFDDWTWFIRAPGSCCCFLFSPDLFLFQIGAIIWFNGNVQGNFFKMLMEMVGQQFWLFCVNGKNQCGRNDWKFDVKMAGLSTMTMLLCFQRCPSRSFSWWPRLQCWHSQPTAWSLSCGSTATLLLWSPVVSQALCSLISLQWSHSQPTASLCSTLFLFPKLRCRLGRCQFESEEDKQKKSQEQLTKILS
jgi:hypothetical protein